MEAQTRLSALAALAVLSPVSALASFDLSLIAENGGNSIRRIDPENRLVLGSFGAAHLSTPGALAVDQANGIVYVANVYTNTFNNRITALNYNTGAFVNEWSLGGTSIITSIAFRPGFGLYVPVGDGIRLYDANGGVRATFTGAGLTLITSVSYSASFNEVYAHDGNGTTRRYASITSGTTSGVGNHAGVQNQVSFAAVNPTVSWGGRSVSDSLVRFDHNSLSTTTVSHSPGFNVTAVNAAHGNRMYAGGRDIGFNTSYITTFDQNGNQVSDRWTVPGGTGIRSMATVVAPEPGTIAALGLGLVALLRRRRNGVK